MNIQSATLDELQAEFARLGDVLAATAQERNQIFTEIQERQKVASAKVRLNLLSKAEKDALREELRRNP